MFIVRELRSQQPSGDARDSQDYDGRLSHQTPQQSEENFAGVYRWERVKVSFMLQKDHSLGWDVNETWVRLPKCSKANLLTRVVVKEK